MRRASSVAGIGFILVGLAIPVRLESRALTGWQGIETRHFAIYSQNPMEEREILTRLETAHTFFAQSSLMKGANDPQLHVLAIGSESAADVYQVNPAAYAFYQRTGQGDFVVMRDLAPEHIPVAIHEYTHFVAEHAGLKLPLWLNEGLADFYSTLEARKTQVAIGNAPSGRVETLESRTWIDWASVFAVNHESVYYRQTDKMLLFYSQSWALVHMLALDERYEKGFAEFVQTVSGGATTEEALRTVYHRNSEEVAQDVKAYVHGRRLTARVMNLDARPADFEVEEIADAQQRAELALGEVLAANPQLAQEANVRLASLADKYPDDPRPEESLGFQAMNAGRNREALEHFAAAVRHHSQNPEVWFRLAHLKLQAEGASEEVVDLLERVIRTNGEHYGARLELGFAAAKTQKYELAVKALEGIQTVKPEHAYTVSYTLAYCLVEIEQGNRARMYAEKARKSAGSNKDLAEVAGLLRYIEQETPEVVASRE